MTEHDSYFENNMMEIHKRFFNERKSEKLKLNVIFYVSWGLLLGTIDYYLFINHPTRSIFNPEFRITKC
jgi:hypothetical protein